MRAIAEIVLIALPLLWAGLLLGASFLGTLAKFKAPSITLPIALDVGRQTFTRLLRIEQVLAVLSILAACYPGLNRESLGLLGLVGVVVFFQSFWLLPILDIRVERIFRGEEPPPSFHHRLYAMLEVLKVFVLILTALRTVIPK